MTEVTSVRRLFINSLFTDILHILSLSELGIGTAMLYAMYKPVAEGDNEAVLRLVNLYRRLYTAVAAFIAVAGLALIPFLHVLIKDSDNVPNLTYTLTVTNTGATPVTTTVVDPLSDDVTFVEASDDGTLSTDTFEFEDTTYTGRNIVWPDITVPVNSSKQLTIKVQHN